MISNNTILAVIPARAGSKRLPGKNMKLFRRKPLVEWTILAAKGSEYLDAIVLDSDDKDFEPIAYRNGIAFHHRDNRLAQDDSPIEECVKVVAKITHFDLVILLQPTSPLRTSEDIDKALELFFQPLDSLLSFCYNDSTLKPNGAIYIKRTQNLLDGEPFFDPHASRIFLMPQKRSIDIDTQTDFDKAENASHSCGHF
jgi:CMP-N,N'-diacetyllegionaminic acid synthase